MSIMLLKINLFCIKTWSGYLNLLHVFIHAQLNYPRNVKCIRKRDMRSKYFQVKIDSLLCNMQVPLFIG